jgi:putative oxidoreductase
MGIGRLFVRGAIGSLMVGHGTQKLFGWFGGGGPEGTGQFFEQVGLRPGRRNALAAGAAEAGGGALLALGLATPLAVAALQGAMVSAIRHVHWQNGPWVTKGGYEYNLVLIAALFGLAEMGPGPALARRRARQGARGARLGAGGARRSGGRLLRDLGRGRGRGGGGGGRGDAARAGSRDLERRRGDVEIVTKRHEQL